MFLVAVEVRLVGFKIFDPMSLQVTCPAAASLMTTRLSRVLATPPGESEKLQFPHETKLVGICRTQNAQK